MSTTTPRVGLYKPADDGSEPANVSTDLNGNTDILEANLGVVPVTALPTSCMDGKVVRVTTAGNRVYYARGAMPGGTWVEIVQDVARLRLTRTAATSVTNSTDYNVIFTASSFIEPSSWWSSGAYLTVPVKGIYIVSASAVFHNAGTNTGIRYVALKDLSTGTEYCTASPPGPGGSSTAWVNSSATQAVELTAGTQCYMNIKQDSGNTMSVEQMAASLVLQCRT